jgi:cytochrome c peroxidase
VFALVGCTTADNPAQTYTWRLPAGMPTPRVPADNPMSEHKVELGRALFYDTRLSADDTQSCATCHQQARAFTDGRTVPVGITGELGRHNAMSLVNVAYNSSSTWASNVARLEDQARMPMFGTHPIELGLADPTLVEDRLGLTIDEITGALASFERTIISGDSPFDRFVAGDTAALTAAEQRGLTLFESDRLDCTHCHGGFNLASSYDTAAMTSPQIQFFNTGLHATYPANDQGLFEVTGNPADIGRFRAPTLRNIALTAPYFHDGSAATLDDVLDHYASGGAADPLKSPFITGFTLTPDERADLLAFLGALTDDSVLTNAAFSAPCSIGAGEK